MGYGDISQLSYIYIYPAYQTYVGFAWVKWMDDRLIGIFGYN